ncbi:hypothetical protein FIBSPDRAFT_218448 [Athelia psychrophila]|uniref:Uncharacterized protein n=1 Tax=Athelia psychrophila TaxID=1759441 RepID=A0A165Z9A3_9AGAM|nr:hypothetical protein FIBSPDRAFT_218448 [Fibularhizoctonia sp. CBS 109695]
MRHQPRPIHLHSALLISGACLPQGCVPRCVASSSTACAPRSSPTAIKGCPHDVEGTTRLRRRPLPRRLAVLVHPILPLRLWTPPSQSSSDPSARAAPASCCTSPLLNPRAPAPSYPPPLRLPTLVSLRVRAPRCVADRRRPRIKDRPHDAEGHTTKPPLDGQPEPRGLHDRAGQGWRQQSLAGSLAGCSCMPTS